jgi:signal transduction histidine kinase
MLRSARRAPSARVPGKDEMSDLDTRVGLAVFQEAPFHAAVIDRRYCILQSNGAFEQTFGKRHGEPCYRVYKGRDAPCEPCVMERALADRSVAVSEETGVTAEGQPITYQARAVPIYADDGQVSEVALLSVDVTHLKAVEAALDEAQRLATVGLVAAGVAHSIKNILAGLEGAMYAVSTGLEKSGEERVKIGWEMVQKYLEQVSAHTRNLLDYAREQEPHREEADPGTLVHDVVGLYDDKASLIGIEIEGRVEGAPPRLRLDPQVMRACLGNLVTNAMDACSWDPDSDGTHHIVVSARSLSTGAVVFKVSDDGMGISPEDQPKLFRSLFTTKGLRGTGLGLLLTKQAVEAHGGNISFSSTPGQGTTFQIELPGGSAEG